MKYKKEWLVGGSKKADSTDVVSAYICENGKRIEVRDIINTNTKFYEVEFNGKPFACNTLKDAKALCEMA